MNGMLSSSVKAVHDHVWELVEDFWEPNAIFGHGKDHAIRSYNYGVHLAEIEGGNPLPIGAACYLMDTGLDPIKGRKEHIKRGIKMAKTVLNQIPELDGFRDIILNAILHHDADNELPDNCPIEVQIVRDSDTLDRLGLTGIKMTLTYGVWVSRPLCSSRDPLCHYRSPKLEIYSMDYIRHLFSLENQLTTPTAKAIAKSKKEEMRAYCETFESLYKKHGILSYEDAFSLVKKKEDEGVMES